jgi:ketosteroid isomerase-like protein
MRYCAFVLVLFCMFVDVIRAADEPKFSDAQQEVLNVSLARRDASNRRDMATLARYIAEDCLFSSDDGTVLTKTQYLQHMAKLPVAYDHSTNPRDFVVHVFESTAVVNFRTTAHEQFGDDDIVSEQRRTETWLKQDGKWRLIAIQWNNLPVNFRKPVAIDATTLKDYLGKYESRPGDDLETVFLKDGKLWSQIQKDVEEYMPAGGDSFFLKEGDLATITFSRDALGHVIGYTYHRIDGQEIHVKKIN